MEKIKNITAPLAGPALFFLFLNLELGLDQNQRLFLSVFVFVVYNWLIAWMPLFVTGFIGVALSVLLGIENPATAFASFANPIIFLFLAGFMFAKSLNETGLDRRISLFILSRKFIGASFDRMLFALFAITAFFSMWVSNTATAAMMLPIVLGTAKSLDIQDNKTLAYMLLGLAYSASVGGLGSPVGSPPNIIAMGMLKELAGVHIGFAQWSFYGAPLALAFLFIIFYYVKKRIAPEQKKINTGFIQKEREKLPSVNSHERWLAFMFCALLTCWFLPGLLAGLMGETYPVLKLIEKRLDPGAVGMLFASALFVFPLGSKVKLLAPGDIKDIDWGSLLLFGSGLALGKILFSTGLAQMAGNFLVENIAGAGLLVLFLALSYFTIFSTELASNTASANILIPIVIAAAGVLGVNATLPAIIVALSCSLAFMLPVATPPNAIVYGSGKVDIPTMIRFGFFLNIVFGAIIALLFYFLSFLL